MRCSSQPTTPTLGICSWGARGPDARELRRQLWPRRATVSVEGGQGRTRDPSGTTRVLAPKRPLEVARAAGGRFPAARGGGASVEGAGPTGQSRGAGRALAAECHTRGGSGGGGRGGGSGSSRRRRTGRGARAPPGAGRLSPSLACIPTHGGAGLAPAYWRSPQPVTARTGQGRAPRGVGALGAGVSGGGRPAFRSLRPGTL